MFADDLQRFTLGLNVKARRVFVETAMAVRDSVVEGSPWTAAPGQPVDTGFLKASWQLSFEGPETALVATNCAYAPVIEYNERTRFNAAGTTGVEARRELHSFQRWLPGELATSRRYGVVGGQIGPSVHRVRGGSVKHHKSTVGGHFSVALTRAGLGRLVDGVMIGIGTAATSAAAEGPSGLP